MPRPNYGPEAKKRTQQFLAVLIDFASNELDCEALGCDEKALDNLRSQIQTHWQSDRRLVVRTKVRFLEALMKLANQPLTIDQIKEALKRLEDFISILEDNRPHRSGSEVWHFTLNLWHSRNDRSANLQCFDTEWEQRRPQKSKQVAPAPPISPAPASPDFWLQLCQSSLKDQQYERLTTNPLTIGDGVAFELAQVYVPLEVERRSSDRSELSTKDATLDDVEESEAQQTIAIDQFLAFLLQSGSEAQRIAIVGEPGSGKTTLLQKVAAYLLDRQLLPIWISLADLQGQTLEQYLLNDWLKTATRQIVVSTELQLEFGQQFNQGRVWLLLDAVDEMAIDASLALSMISRQLRGWIADAHVVLTCRSNLWDAGKNTLETFSVYRNLSFSVNASSPAPSLPCSDSADQVSQFIQRWFQTNPTLGDQLRAELDQLKRKRLKDAVRNPLRLALLCRSWSLAQGNLPQTRAALYQQFIDRIYEWKQDRFPTTFAQRHQLNQALGTLALKALQQEEIKFRLPHLFAVQALGPENLDQLSLALQLGWLNQVGVSKTGDKIYAFYHPTFQEYFAAQAITDWHFFTSGTAPPVLTTHWRQTILLWLGRSNISATDKQDFIVELTQFEDDCGGFYGYQAVFLAAAGLAECPDCVQAKEIVRRLVHWRFGEWDTKLKSWKIYPLPIQEGARVALLQTDRPLAISTLEEFVSTAQNLFACWTSAYSLGKIMDPGNPIAIATLTELLEQIEQEIFQIQVSESLGKVDPGNAIAIARLEKLSQTLESEALRRKAAYSLGKIDANNLIAIATLTQLAETAEDPHLRQQAAKNLLQFCPDSTLEQSSQAQVILQQQQISRRSRKRLHQSPTGLALDRAIENLSQRLAAAQSSEAQRRLAYQLGKLQPGHAQAIKTLMQLLLTDHPPSFYKRTAEYLKAVILDEQLPLLTARLRHFGQAMEQGDRSQQALECYKLLWYCAEQLPYSQFQQAWQEPTGFESNPT